MARMDCADRVLLVDIGEEHAGANDVFGAAVSCSIARTINSQQRAACLLAPPGVVVPSDFISLVPATKNI
jgi:hypothetical protein